MTESLRPEAGYGSAFVTRDDLATWWQDFAAPNESQWIDYLFKLGLIEFDQERQAFVMAEECYDQDWQMELLEVFEGLLYRPREEEK